MRYGSQISTMCLIGAGLVFCGPAAAADDATSICNAAINAYGAAATSGDPEKMAAVFAADGELVSPWGVSRGHDELVKTYASFMKPGDKDAELPDELARDRRRGAVRRRLYFHAGLGRIGLERLLDEGRRQGGRRLENSESDLHHCGAPIDPPWVAVPRAARAAGEPGGRPAPYPDKLTRIGSRSDWLRPSRRSPRQA